MVKIAFETTPADTKTYFENFIKNNRIMRLFPLIWAVVLALGVARIFLQNSGSLAIAFTAALILGLVMYIGMFWMIRFITNRITVGMITRMQAGGAFGRIRLTLKPNALLCKTKQGEESLPYDMVGRIIETDHYVGINIGHSLPPTIIPRDQVETSNLEAFLAQLRVHKS